MVAVALVPPLVVLGLILASYLVLGCFLEGIAVLVIVLAVSVLSVRRVIVMEPAEVFK